MNIKCVPFVLLLFLSACAPGLGTKLTITSLPDIEEKDIHKDPNNELIKVSIMPFIDTRSSEKIADVNGRSVNSEGKIGLVVQDGFSRAFKKAGMKVCLFDCPIVGGEVNDWRIDVSPAFPTSSVHAIAKIRVTVFNLQNDLIYSARYSGSTDTKDPFLTESRIEEVLGVAMNYAIAEALKDERLIGALGKVS